MNRERFFVKVDCDDLATAERLMDAFREWWDQQKFIGKVSLVDHGIHRLPNRIYEARYVIKGEFGWAAGRSRFASYTELRKWLESHEGNVLIHTIHLVQ